MELETHEQFATSEIQPNYLAAIFHKRALTGATGLQYLRVLFREQTAGVRYVKNIYHQLTGALNI